MNKTNGSANIKVSAKNPPLLIHDTVLHNGGKSACNSKIRKI